MSLDPSLLPHTFKHKKTKCINKINTKRKKRNHKQNRHLKIYLQLHKTKHNKIRKEKKRKAVTHLMVITASSSLILYTYVNAQGLVVQEAKQQEKKSVTDLKGKRVMGTKVLQGYVPTCFFF